MANYERTAYEIADEKLKADTIVVEAPELTPEGSDKTPVFRFKRSVTAGDLAAYMDGLRHGMTPDALTFALLWIDEDGNHLVEAGAVTKDANGVEKQEPTWFEKVDVVNAINIVRRGNVTSQTFGRLTEKMLPILADGDTPEDEKKPSET